MIEGRQSKEDLPMDPSIYNELAEFMAAVNRGGSCPSCGGTIQHKGDWYRCKRCGVEFRRTSTAWKN